MLVSNRWRAAVVLGTVVMSDADLNRVGHPDLATLTNPNTITVSLFDPWDGGSPPASELASQPPRPPPAAHIDLAAASEATECLPFPAVAIAGR
jgi:hypothetical protein